MHPIGIDPAVVPSGALLAYVFDMCTGMFLFVNIAYNINYDMILIKIYPSLFSSNISELASRNRFHPCVDGVLRLTRSFLNAAIRNPFDEVVLSGNLLIGSFTLCSSF